MDKRQENPFRRYFTPVFWSILVGTALYGLSVLVSDLQAVGDALARFSVAGWGMILGLSLVNYALRFLRWQGYLARLGHSVPAGPSLAYYLGGFAFTTTPGKAGEAIRSLYLKRHGVAYVHSLAAFFSERLIDLVAMVLLALGAAYAFPDMRWPVVALTLAILAMLPLVHSSRVHRFLDQQRARFTSLRLRTLGSRLLDLLRHSAVLLRSGILYWGLFLALAAWGAEGVAFHVILDTIGLAIALPLAVGIYAVSILVGAISFIPGGLGSTEAVMGLLLVLLGADTATAVAATLICRIATLWFAVAIGLGVVTVLELRTSDAKPMSK